MDWRNLITDFYSARPRRPGIAWEPRFYPCASAGEIVGAEDRLGATLPASLRSLLAQTDGVMDRMAVDGGGWFDALWLVWPVAEIVGRNRALRVATGGATRACDVGDLVFFADAGCDGIGFAFPVGDDRTCGPRVVAWHPLRDSVTELAPCLEDFLRGWLMTRPATGEHFPESQHRTQNGGHFAPSQRRQGPADDPGTC